MFQHVFCGRGLAIGLLLCFGCVEDKVHDDSGSPANVQDFDPDVNGDGSVHILVLGSSISIDGSQSFSPVQIAEELRSILSADPMMALDVQVIAEDIYTSTPITIGLGGSGTEYTYTHYRHSLMQYYHWPENREARVQNLLGNGAFDWDYVVIGADPYFVEHIPGYYALGAHTIAKKIVEGGAVPLLLMLWTSDENSSSEHFEEFTYRTAQGSSVPLSVVPAGLAWSSLSEDKKDTGNVHPSPNGAYIAAASIYSQLSSMSASSTSYTYDDELADMALDKVIEQVGTSHSFDVSSFVSPFQHCSITQTLLTYNHTGSSSENGILGGLNWVFAQSNETLENGGGTPITFNFGRANSNFEPNKRYQVNAEMFEFSFGFPMQDHGTYGDESMLYGLDKRAGGVMNDTDVGVARFMIEESEMPYARAIPIRSLYAQMREANDQQSAYRDSWHMHRDLDKAIGAYMHTLLTNQCSLGGEPVDTSTAEWNTWNAHKIGCDTAWELMYLEDGYPF